MLENTYVNRIFFDVQRHKYKVIEEVSVTEQSVLLKTADNKFLKIFHSLGNIKPMSDRLKWLKSLGDRDDDLTKMLALPYTLLTGLKRGEVGYVYKTLNECTLTCYIKPERGEKLFKWYYEKTGGIEYRLKIAYKIASMMQQVHSKGICLVDVCPDNTSLQPFSSENRKPLGVQFTGADSISSFTYCAQSTGVSRYIDPLVNQYRTAPSSVSDTFSFAIMIFEMLTTCHPFYGEDAESLSENQFCEMLAQGSLEYIGNENVENNKNEIFEDTQLFIPDELAVLFDKMFIEGKMEATSRPTLNDFKIACIRSMKKLIKCDHIGCEKEYPYNIGHFCPFCNKNTKRVILARLQKIVSSSEKMLLPHDGIELFSALPVLTEDINYMVLRPGLNGINRSFFEPSEKDTAVILIQYSKEKKRIAIRNKFSDLNIRVLNRILMPYTKEDNGQHSDIGFPENKKVTIELPTNAQIEPERIVPIVDEGYGVIEHKWVISIE